MRILLRRLALVLAGALLALASAELWARRSFPVRRPIFRLDPELLHEPVPSGRRVMLLDVRNGGAAVPLAFDERGLRRPWSGSVPVRRPERPLVAVVGDSLVLAESVPFEETFVEHLGRELAALGRPVDVVNAGVSGYGPDQTLLRLEQMLPGLRPDHVVLVVCAHNDYGDLVRNKLFALDAGGRLVRRPALPDAVLAARWELRAREGRRPALRRILDLWRDRRALARARREEGPRAWIEWYLEGARREWEEYAGGDLEVHSLLVDFYDADVVLRPEEPPALGKRALARALSGRFAALARDAGIGLTVVVVPSAVDADPTFDIRVDPASHPGYDPERLGRAWCEDLAPLEPFDAWPVLTGMPDPSAAWIGGIDFHWSAAGQAAVAAAVAPRVAARL